MKEKIEYGRVFSDEAALRQALGGLKNGLQVVAVLTVKGLIFYGASCVPARVEKLQAGAKFLFGGKFRVITLD